MDSFSSLIHQQLFLHELVRVVLHWSHPSTVVSCSIWYGFLYLSRPSTVVLYIIWYGKSFVGLIHQQLFRASSGMDSFRSPVHQQLLVHDLLWVVLHWQHASTVVSCMIWNGFFHLPIPSTVASCIWNDILHPSRPITVVLYIIWYGKSLIGLIHQQFFLCIIWYGFLRIGFHTYALLPSHWNFLGLVLSLAPTSIHSASLGS